MWVCECVCAFVRVYEERQRGERTKRRMSFPERVETVGDVDHVTGCGIDGTTN